MSFLQRVLTRRGSLASPDFDPHGSLGLNLLHSPSDPLLDLVFVHGLGGGSTKTWCFSENSAHFWPKAWLPRANGLQNVRIHSYGYDSQWTSTTATPYIDITDFGHQFLEKLRNSTELKQPQTTPIIFIAHSMGGLVAKQAYVLARQDPSCAEMAKRVEGMIFLSTPHRGSNLAQTLNNILRITFTHTTRPYIANLSQQNSILHQLNENFRHYADDLTLYSFYESRATDLFVRSELIVTRESAVMGYPKERHAMLDADHRGVCKYESPSDPNYETVLQAIQSLAEQIIGKYSVEIAQVTEDAMQQIERYLSMPAKPENDLKDLEEARIEGSCEWFADKDTFQKWLDPDSTASSMVYWVSANPGTGKSVLSSYAINAVTNLNLDCSYCFFRHGDKEKSTISGCLRSILLQMAVRSAEVRRHILTMIEKVVRFDKDDAKVIWRKIMSPVLSKADPKTVHYWVIDALDECVGFEPLFSMLATLDSEIQLRILITSRNVQEISQGFADLKRSHDSIAIHEDVISFEDTEADIRLYLEKNRHKFHVGNERQKDRFIDRILERSEGCFLWVCLVLKELALAWSVDAIEHILDDVPRDMDPLYTRAIRIMSEKVKPNRDLIHAILSWVVCAVRPLTVAELREALKLDLNERIEELEEAITSLCAQLVHVDKSGRVMIVHLTAKTFLTNEDLDSEFRIEAKLGHLRLVQSCLKFLCSDQMKAPRNRRAKRKHAQGIERSLFADYACHEFAEHLRHTTSGISTVSKQLYDFLDDNVLSWIEFVAAAGNMSILTRTANSINSYTQRHIRSSSPLGEFVHLTQNWAVDLHRIVAGFGPNLLECPSAIFWLIPPFCPKSSAIASTVGSKFKHMTVRGLTDEGWNDRISCIDSQGPTVAAVACADSVFAAGHNTDIGSVILYYNSTCLPWKTFQHGSPVRHLLFNSANTMLLSVGRRDIKVWDVDNDFVLWTATLTHDVMCVAITEDGKTVMAADKSDTFTTWDLQHGQRQRAHNWGEKLLFPEEMWFRRPPLAAAIGPDPSLIAIVYRGRPIWLYDLDDEIPHGSVSREGYQHMSNLGSMTSVSSLVFNTKKDSHLLAAAYEDGDLCLFDYEDLRLIKSIEGANAYTVACSPDGLTLATGNSAGMVQLLEFETLQLLYRVNATDYGIRALAFSADNLRFLDVRQTQCNVWEPAVLSGLAKRDDSSTEPEWEPVIKGMDNADVEVTCIEVLQTGSTFFVGRSDGSLSLYNANSDPREKVVHRHNYDIAVTSAFWGAKKHLIATSDTACRFIVFALQEDPIVGWKVASKIMDARADSMIYQLLLDPSNDLLLVSTEKSNTVWDLRTMHMVCSHPWSPSSLFSWINHPGSTAHCVLISAAAISVFDWLSFNQINSVVLPTFPAKGVHGRSRGVKNAFAFAEGRSLVIELSDPYEKRAVTETLLFNWNALNPTGQILSPAVEFGEVRHKIRHVIGGYKTKLLFIDTSRWVSSIDATQQNSGYYLRHFPIPTDWYIQQRILHMAVATNGDIFFVRTNEVAVISHGLDFAEPVLVEQKAL